MSGRFDFAVVGAGIVGLATATALARRHPQASIVVLEAADAVGVHQTGHNSGVLHSGLYYTPGSLRARLCVAGRRMMLEFCQEHGIAHAVTGKLVVATQEREVPRLEKLLERGKANGLTGLAWLGREEWREIEPNLVGLAAIWVPEAGVVDFGAVARRLAENLAGEVRLGWPVTGIENRSGDWELTSPQESLRARRLVTCAGLHSDRVARLAGARPQVSIVPFRGEYFTLNGAAADLVRHLIYPVPDPRFPFLGVHFTRRIDGSVEVGPNAVPAAGRHHYRGTRPDLFELARTFLTPGFPRLALRYAGTGIAEIVRSRSRVLYARAASRLVPGIAASDLTPGGAGVRAQAISRDGRLVDDFAIVEGERALHLVNAPSPGATASLAIGKFIADRVD